MGASSGSREPSRVSPSRPVGFDPAREMLSGGALRALLRHTRRDGDGGLFDSVLGVDDAEELWFCSMLRAANGKERLVRREPWVSSLSGQTTYTFFLTDAGRALHAKAAQSPSGDE